MKSLLVLLSTLLLYTSCQSQKNQTTNLKTENMQFPIIKTDAQWQEELSPEQYYILREKGTERPGTGEYYMHFEKGTYVCAGCGTELFSSDNKFESHCGWPSFDDAIVDKVIYQKDSSHGMIRTEILCATCGGHLGHVFDDGPRETTGQRYCVNSLSIEFKE